MLVPLPDCLKLQVLLVAEVAAVDGNLWVASACGMLSILSGIGGMRSHPSHMM